MHLHVFVRPKNKYEKVIYFTTIKKKYMERHIKETGRRKLELEKYSCSYWGRRDEMEKNELAIWSRLKLTVTHSFLHILLH